MRILAKTEEDKPLTLFEVLAVDYDPEERELLLWTDDAICNFIASKVSPEFWANAAQEALRNGYLDLSEFEVSMNLR